MTFQNTTRIAAAAILFASLTQTTFPARAAELLSDGGFEMPALTERTARDKGGDPSNGNKGPTWTAFLFTPNETDLIGTANAKPTGQFTAGLTNEIAHSGKQSFFIEYNHASEPGLGAMLQSRLIPIAPRQSYRASIWGRLDEKNPILGGVGKRLPYLKLEVEFYSQNGVQSVGNAVFNVQPIPGTPTRPPFFTADKWREFVTDFRTPDGAIFARLTWQWEAGSSKGEINGVAFFDDASLTGPAAPDPNATPASIKKRSHSSEAASELDVPETPSPGAAKQKDKSSPLPYVPVPLPPDASELK